VPPPSSILADLRTHRAKESTRPCHQRIPARVRSEQETEPLPDRRLALAAGECLSLVSAAPHRVDAQAPPGRWGGC